jgi:hypothetical protein
VSFHSPTADFLFNRLKALAVSLVHGFQVRTAILDVPDHPQQTGVVASESIFFAHLPFLASRCVFECAFSYVNVTWHATQRGAQISLKAQ